MPLIPPKNIVFTQDAPTFIRAKEISLAPGKYVILNGGVVGWHRKQIVITNEDNASTKVYVVNGPDGNVDPDTTTEKGLTIAKGESLTLFTNGSIVLKNLHASETCTSIQILETFYI